MRRRPLFFAGSLPLVLVVTLGVLSLTSHGQPARFAFFAPHSIDPEKPSPGTPRAAHSGVLSSVSLPAQPIPVPTGHPGTNSVPLPDDQGTLSPGTHAQWKVYSFTNEPATPHIVVATILPRFTGNFGDLSTNLHQQEADIDLYVSTNSGLASLDPVALSGAWTSLGRGGLESVLIPDAPAGVFYVAVKTESLDTASFELVVAGGEEPFAEADSSSNLLLRAFPAPVALSDAIAQSPGLTRLLAVAPAPIAVHRVILTNVVQHLDHSELLTQLSHAGITATLQQAGGVASGGLIENVYDDSLQKDIDGARNSSGPGTLAGFSGANGHGQWHLTQTDVLAGNSGTNEGALLFLERQPAVAAGANVTILPGAAYSHTLYVNADATNLLVTVPGVNETEQLRVRIQAHGEPPSDASSVHVPVGVPALLSRNKYSVPPLNAGFYSVTVENLGPDAITTELRVVVESLNNPEPHVRAESAWHTPIFDNASTTSPIAVNHTGRVAKVEVNVRLMHRRLSDLAVRLVSPSGTSVMLAENRGAGSSEGFGFDNIVTNTMPVSSFGGPEASTNTIYVGPSSGKIEVDYHFYALPDELRVYRGTTLIFSSGMAANSGHWAIAYGEHQEGKLTIVVNEGENSDPDTFWDYVVTSTRPGMVPVRFTENTNFAPHLIKFVAPPFTNASPVGPGETDLASFLRPEESLDAFIGEQAAGVWKLELLDRFPGPPNSVTLLNKWELLLTLDQPEPLPTRLSHDTSFLGRIPPGRFQPFVVPVPVWTGFATNILVSSSAPLRIWFNPLRPPTGTNPGDILLDSSSVATRFVFSESSQPAMVRGRPYYISLLNPGAEPVDFEFRVEFDIPTLTPNGSQQVTVDISGTPSIYVLDVDPETASLSLALNDLTGNLDLFLRKGGPPPGPGNYDYGSFNMANDNEEIAIDESSIPMPLSPGRWYVTVFNNDPQDASGILNVRSAERPPVIHEAGFSRGSFRIGWLGTPGAEYEVYWTPALDPANWSLLVSPVLQENGNLVVLDDGTQTGGFNGFSKFYRVLKKGVPSPP